MWASELERGEIKVKLRLQLLAVPGKSAKELFVVVAGFVPVRQQRAGEIQAFAVPALRNHVYLPADLLLVLLARLMRIRHVENAALTIAEAIHEQGLVIRADANVHRQHPALDLPNIRDFLCLP